MRIAPTQIATALGLSVALFFLPSAFSQQVFFGNLHSHTSYSDGSGTPEQAYIHAKDTARLDFLAITDHNHNDAENGASDDRRDGILIANDPSLYVGPQAEAIIPTANRLSENGKFIAIYGQEFSSISSGNHVNVFEIGNVITVGNGKFNELITTLTTELDSTGNPAIIQFNHPTLLDKPAIEYGADDFPSTAEWMAAMGRHASLIEIANGPAMTKVSGNRPAEIMEKDFLAYLNLGFHLAPTANQDNHYLTWGTATDARTAVLADSLTKANILDGLRNRRVYASEDKNLRLIFRVNGQLMGTIIREMPVVGEALQIEYSIADDDEPSRTYSIEVFSDAAPGGDPAKVVEKITLPSGADGSLVGTIDAVPFTGAGQYLFFKVTQRDEDDQRDRAWTAPVWFETSGASGGTGVSANLNVHIESLLPNPTGNEVENEEATLINRGTQAVSMIGWRLVDLANQHWVLDSLGTMQPGESKTIRRAGQPMVMNNTKDSITLVDPAGNRVQTVTYTNAAQGVRVIAL